MKGLEESITVSIVHPTWQRTRAEEDDHIGWVFRSPSDDPVIPLSGFGSVSCEGCIPDTINSFRTVRDIYEFSDDKAGKYTVPVLFCKETNRIVNNESSEIIRLLNRASDTTLDLYPEHLRDEIDEVNAWIYSQLNTGVYRCGFAQSQEAYAAAFEDVYSALMRIENILSTKR